MVWCSPLPPPKSRETKVLYKTHVICIALAFTVLLLQPYPIFPFSHSQLTNSNGRLVLVLVLRVCVIWVGNNEYTNKNLFYMVLESQFTIPLTFSIIWSYDRFYIQNIFGMLCIDKISWVCYRNIVLLIQTRLSCLFYITSIGFEID